MSKRGRRHKGDGCGCVYLAHERTGANVTVLKWCETHRPKRSMTGKPHPKDGR